MQKRRKRSKELKLEVVNLTNLPGVTHNQIAQDCVIGAGTLGRWGKKSVGLTSRQANEIPFR